MRFQLPSWVQGQRRRNVAALASAVVLAVASLILTAAAQAQSFTWGSAGSTTDYNLGTNWTPSVGAPPLVAGQSAVFDTTGTTAVGVTAGPIAPDSWTFNATSQSYTVSGADVNFSLAGPGGGIINNNADPAQTVSIGNNIGESVAGVQVQQLAMSTLMLSGINTYTGGTTVSNGGTLQVTNNSSVGTGTVTLQDGLFQAAGSGLTFSNNFRINNTALGSFIDANGFTLTIAGNIADGNGPGHLSVVDNSPGGGGSVVLLGNNTYSGGTLICFCGTLQLGDATHTASMIGDITNEGQFSVFNANTAGIASITNQGGRTDFFNATTAGTATIVNQFGGTTVFNDSSSAMNANITNMATGGSTLFFGNSSAGNALITNNSASGSVFVSPSD